MMNPIPLLALILSLLSIHAVESHNKTVPKVGICYGRVGDNLPHPSITVQLLKTHKISKVRLFDADPTVLRAFSGSGIELMIGVPNELLPTFAFGGCDTALEWIKSNILAFVSADQVRYLAVGNEVLFKDPFYTPHVIPALWNCHQALQKLGLANRVKISSPQALAVLGNSFPPSGGLFDSYILPVMRPLLGFLAETGAPLMVNIYPYFSYLADPENVPLNYALCGPGAAPVHDGGIAYHNLFDGAMDAIISAMEREGFSEVGLVVTETGWPTAGGAGAELEKAAAFNRHIVKQVLKGAGTPKKPNIPMEVFLFGLFDENGKGGAEFEKHFGIFKVDGSIAYNISFA